MNTSIENKITILSSVWMNCRDEVEYGELFEFCDIAFPLAFCVEASIVARSERADVFFDEAFELLLELLEIEDTGYLNFDEMLDAK
jgi:hypothetical protein